MRGGKDPAWRPRAARAIELGNEPALSVDRRSGPPAPKAVSIRWLSGTILTGFASTALMGGALYASLDWEMRFARSAEFIASSSLDVPAPGAAAHMVEKSDRLPVSLPLFATRQVVRLDTIMRVGDREFVKVRPFVKVSASLALSRSELTANLPPFDPHKIFTSSTGKEEPLAKIVERRVEGEVSFVLKELDDSTAEFESVGDLADEEIARMVRETAEIGVAQSRAAAALMPIDLDDPFPGVALAFGRRDLDAFADLAVRGYAENVSLVAKSARRVAEQAQQAALGPDDRIVEVAEGDTLASILMRHGANSEEAAAITAVMQERFAGNKLEPGLRLRLGISAGEDDRTRLRPVRVSAYQGDEHRATVALSDNGAGYVAIDDPADLIADVADAAEETETPSGPLPTLHASLFETAFKYGLSRSLAETLVRVYSFDVDFQRPVKPGDSLEVFYAQEDGSDEEEIFYAALAVDGQTRRFYRFQAPDDGSIGFYDETGKSARKFLMNKPLAGGIFRSGFGMRKHPILGYAKMHTGVDYAAPRGTPIMAAGSGTIEKAGWESGYGKYVRIRHANGYETAYGHMSDLARGMSPGTKVRQGQIVGYVGSTGLSTGNHLHYEVIVNGRFVNPARLKVPRGRELKGVELASFLRERDRIDAVMTRSSPITRMAEAPGSGPAHR